MRFRLASRLMTLDDLELLSVRIFGEFRGISQIWEATTAKRLKIDPHCQRQRSNPQNVFFDICFLALICRRFLHYTHCCRALNLAIARLSGQI